VNDQALPRWDLTAIYPTPGDSLVDVEGLAERCAALAERAEAAFGADDAAVVDAVGHWGMLERALENVEFYAWALQYNDAASKAVEDVASRLPAAIARCRADLRRVELAWCGIDDDRAQTLARTAELAPVAHRLQLVREHAARKMSAEAERVFAARAEPASAAWIALRDRIVSAKRVTFDDGSGEDTFDFPALRNIATHHESRSIRIGAYEALGRGVGEIADTVAACWDAVVADRLVEDELRGHAHPAEATLEEQDLPLAAFTSLLDAVADAHDELQDVLRARARELGLNELHITDLIATPPGLPDITFEDAWAASLHGLRSLAPELEVEARRLIEARRIDAEDRPGKQGGAICIISRLDPPGFVGLRFTGKILDAIVLAHELGHATSIPPMRRQPPLTGTFNALFEVPSITAELMAGDLLAERDPALSAAIGRSGADALVHLVFGASTLARIEFDLFAERRAGRTLTPSRIADVFRARHQEMTGDTVAYSDDAVAARMGLASVLGVTTRFYNFQYALAGLVALALVAQAKEDPERFAPRYVEFLSSGTSNSPEDQLRVFGLELGSREMWDRSLAELAQRLQSSQPAAVA
jgi:oligoendopeptidase F